MKRRQIILALPAATAGAWAPRAWSQQAATTTPLTIVLPYPPGGSADTTVRLIADEISKETGRPTVVLSKPGGNTLIGNSFAAKADADGNTVLVGANTGFVNNMGLYDKLPYDPVKDFEPVVLLTTLPLMIAARPDAPFKTLAEMVAYAKANPDKVTRSSAGTGNITNIGFRLFEDARGFKTWHVPYAGDPGALNALLAGQVDLYMTTVALMRQHVQSGRIRGMAMLGKYAKRDAVLTDVPTVTEAGFPDFDVDSWYAFFVPAKTPLPVIEELNRVTNAVLRKPNVIEALRRFGVEPAGGSPADLQKRLDSDRARWVPEIRRMGIKADQ